MDNNTFKSDNCSTSFWLQNSSSQPCNQNGLTGPGFLYAIVDSDCNLIIYRTDYQSHLQSKILVYHLSDLSLKM
jgi:hypothetical protein